VEREPEVAGDDRLTTADAPGPVSVGPVAVDAEGGDRAPAEILAGAAQAAERGRAVLVVGREDVVAPRGPVGQLDASRDRPARRSPDWGPLHLSEH
jgi:hypothetical protein